MSSHNRVLALTSAAGVAALAGSALGAMSISPNIVTITATSGANTATLVVPIVDDPMDALPPVDEYTNLPIANFLFTGWDWASQGSFSLVDPNTNFTLLTISNLSITSGQTLNTNNGEYRWGHEFDWSIIAGNGDVSVNITTGVLGIDPLSFADGRAEMSMNFLHSAGSAPGVTAGGLLDDGYAFNALYSGASLFREYIHLGAATTDPTLIFDSGLMAPPGSTAPVGATVSSLQAVYAFSLSANDQASSTGVWGVVPSPGAGALLGLGALGLMRRSRRN